MKELIHFQRSELTDHHLYLKLAKGKGWHNKKVLEEIAKDENIIISFGKGHGEGSQIINSNYGFIISFPSSSESFGID